MNIRRSRLTAGIILILSLLALYASLSGVLDKKLYTDLFLAGQLSKFLMTGSLAQDIISIPLSLILALLSLIFLRNPGPKTFIAMLGLTGYFFYGYGLYALQGQYTSLYLIYLAIFGLAIYSLIFGLTSFEQSVVQHYRLPSALRISISIFLLLIIFILVPVWLIRILPDIAKHVPGEIYGVFVLDLAVVFPAIGIIAVKLLRKDSFAHVLAGVALFKVLTVCLSVAFGECFLPLYSGFPPNYANIVIFTGLTLASLLLIICYMLKFNLERR